MPGDHPQVLRGRSEQPNPQNPAGVPSSEIIRGSLNLADSVKAKVPAGGTIFLIARALSPSGGPGPVLAAKRLTVGVWPQPFELTANDVMLSGTSLQGKVILGARVDQDGDAMTKQAGDVEGISTPIEVPANGVVLLLDKLRTESAGAPSPASMGGNGPMPAGHPPTEMPAGHPPTELPAGHPSIAPTGDAAAAPTGAVAPSLPAGHPPMGKPAVKPVAKPLPKPAGTAPAAKPAAHPPTAAPAAPAAPPAGQP
jgi:hypothetical protein